MIRKIYSIIVLSACLLCVPVASSAQNAVEEEQNTEAAVAAGTENSDGDLVNAAQEEMNGEALAARADSAYSADNFTLAEQLYKAAMAAEGDIRASVLQSRQCVLPSGKSRDGAGELRARAEDRPDDE